METAAEFAKAATEAADAEKKAEDALAAQWNVEANLSTWTCTVKFKGPPTNEAAVKESDWSMRDISGPTRYNTDLDKVKLDDKVRELVDTVHKTVPDVADIKGEFINWGIDKARSNIEIYKTEQHITTCAMWRKLKTGQDEGKFDLTIENPDIFVILGFQAQISKLENNGDNY